MPKYMIIKIYRDGSFKTDFLDDRKLLDDTLKFLREIERGYKVFHWSDRVNGYVLEAEWKG